MAKRKSSQARQAQRAKGRKKITTKAAEDVKPTLSAEEMFRQDYAYVLKDLRQVLILAVVLFALLIVINLVLG